VIRVRNLREGEAMPEGFYTGYEHMPVMRDWAWVAEGEEILAILLAAPCHGLVYFMRLCVKQGAGRITAMALIRGCMRDCEKRGFKGYFFHVSGMSQVERSLIPIVRKAGGVQITQPQMMLVGPIDEAARR
jgi:hypothetical protein